VEILEDEVTNGSDLETTKVINIISPKKVLYYYSSITSDFIPKVLCIETGVRSGPNTIMWEF